MRKFVLLSIVTPAVFVLALGAAAAAPPSRCACTNTAAAAEWPLDAEPAPAAEAMTPVPASKPQEECPGEFDTSRVADYDQCTLENCHRWCVEDGGSYAAFEAWILPGICACKCCT